MDEPVTGFDDAEDDLLVKSRYEIEETWELVSKPIVEKGGRDHTAEMCAHRYYFLLGMLYPSEPFAHSLLPYVFPVIPI